MNRISSSLIAAAALAAAGAATAGTPADSAFEDSPWAQIPGYSLQLDNDLFSGTNRDQDYTAGVALTFSSPRPGALLRPLHAMRAQLDSWLAPEESQKPGWRPDQQATQIGMLVMTPEDLWSSAPVVDDRPYASLLFVTSSRVRVLDSGDRARFSSFTLGMLGLELAGDLQRSLHSVTGGERPRGWDHQISDGGEPTARYVEAQQWLFGGVRPELKFTVAGSAGFITEGSVALSARWGHIESPWWSFSPELGDYTAAPVAPVTRFSSRSPTEVFAFAGVRLKARAYNALLQGQFRHSDVRVQEDDVAHVLAEAWLGLATKWSGFHTTYAIHYTSPEMTREPGERSMIWAGITLEKSF